MLSPWKKAFTLIEMLIVIVIIGILAAALVPRLISVQGRARDTRRRTDTLLIYNSLLSYQLNNGYVLDPAQYWENDSSFTGTFGNGDLSNTGGYMSFLVSGGVLTSVPVDPINSGPGNSVSYNMYLYRCALPFFTYPWVLLRVVFESYTGTWNAFGFFYPGTGGWYRYGGGANGAQLTEFTCA